MSSFVVALVVAAAVTPIVVRVAGHWELLDVPNHRSSHARPIPRGGGIAVAVAAVCGVAAGGEWNRPVAALVVGALVLGATGLVDDRIGLPALPRLVVQFTVPIAAAVVVLLGRSATQTALGIAAAAVLVAAYVNAFNFMDGINGISGTQAAIAGVFLAALADRAEVRSLTLVGLAVAGASVGFLPFNVPNARIFLGDVGSYFVGFWLAAAALLVVDADAPVAVVVAPFLLYLLDTSSVLVRRARRGERLTEAHREHAYQLLVQRGWSHVSVTACCAVVAIVCCVLLWATVGEGLAWQLPMLAACVAIVAGFLSLPHVLARRAERTVS